MTFAYKRLDYEAVHHVSLFYPAANHLGAGVSTVYLATHSKVVVGDPDNDL